MLVGAVELMEWPGDIVNAMSGQGLLSKAASAGSVVCPGCENTCAMPVHVRTTMSGTTSAFVVCDRRDDISRVPVPLRSLDQWAATGEAVAGLLARLLDFRRPEGEVTPGRWEVGMLRGARHASHLVLIADGTLRLTFAGHSVLVADVLTLKGERFAVDRRTLVRLVDAPIAAAGAGDAQSVEQRRSRIQARVNTLKAKGEKAFLQIVADEEGVHKSRIQQILRGSAETGERIRDERIRAPGALSRNDKRKK